MDSINKISTDLVIFDLDGTLVDSSGDIVWAANRTLESMGRVPLDMEFIKASVGWGVKSLFERLMPKDTAGAVEEARGRFLEIYGARLAVETFVYPGVVETLEEFRELGLSMAVVSNKVEALSKRVLGEFELTGFFDIVLGGDSLAEKKPHPAPLQKVLEVCGTGPERAVMVGDSAIDCRAGHAAHLFTVGALYGFRPRPELEEAGFDSLIDSFTDLKEVLTNR